MTQQIIQVGTAPNDGQGDPIRTAFIKCNNNFTQLYERAQVSPPPTLIGSLGDLAGMYAYDSSYFYYCFANYNGSTAIWAELAPIGNISATQILNGTSSIVIANPNGNATVGINGTSNVAVFTSTGANITGYLTASGNVTGNYILGNGSQLTGLPATYSDSNVTSLLSTFGSNTISTTGNITSGYFFGNGSQLTGIASSYGNADVAAYLPTYTGNLSADIISSTGNITGANINAVGRLSATGNVQANYLKAATDVIVGGNISTTNLTGTGVSVTANITGGNLITNGIISATGNIAGNYFVGNGSQLTGLSGTYSNSNVSSFLSAFGSNTISTTGTITSGNITGGNILTGGAISSSGTITAASIVGGVITGTSTSVTGSQTAASTIGGVITGSSTSVTGAVTGASVVGTIYTNSINNNGSNATGNIGSSSTYFDTVFATATTALYADLAECYLADEAYAPGTVLSFGGDNEVTISNTDADPLIVGVVSTNPAYKMNSGLTGDHVVTVALTGRVPCRVQGPVTRGAMMVSAGTGRARAESNPAMGTVIGKAVESFTGDIGTIEIVVGRL